VFVSRSFTPAATDTYNGPLSYLISVACASAVARKVSAPADRALVRARGSKLIIKGSIIGPTGRLLINVKILMFFDKERFFIEYHEKKHDKRDIMERAPDEGT
jgi:hypothetical protein